MINLIYQHQFDISTFAGQTRISLQFPNNNHSFIKIEHYFSIYYSHKNFVSKHLQVILYNYNSIFKIQSLMCSNVLLKSILIKHTFPFKKEFRSKQINFSSSTLLSIPLLNSLRQTILLLGVSLQSI